MASTDAQGATSPPNSLDRTTGIPNTHFEPAEPIQPLQISSTPVEMSNLDPRGVAEHDESSIPVNSPDPVLEDFQTTKENQSPNPESSAFIPETEPAEGAVLPSEPSNKPPNPVEELHPLTPEKTAPAIGPSSDKPTQLPKENEAAASSLLITLLLTTGARHPYKIDEKYLKKRNVSVVSNNPVNMSVYTLKELIWREWREEWEARPSSPSSIRLIHFGKMLDDKAHLKDSRFEVGTTPHVVHMTIKPQDMVDEEDAKTAKAGGRDRDGNERSPGCRCVIL